MNYYIAENGQQRGPYPPEQMLQNGCRPDSMVWTEGMAQWLPAQQVVELRGIFASAAPQGQTAPPNYGAPQGYAAPQQGYPPQAGYPAGVPPYTPGDSKKIAAGICALLLGTWGVHKFILGYTGAGLIMLLVSLLTCGAGTIVMWPISIIEGIIYLTKTDEQFYQEYVVQRKEWF